MSNDHGNSPDSRPTDPSQKQCLPEAGFRLRHMRDGLAFHASIGHESGKPTEPSMLQSGLICSVIFEGCIHGKYGDAVVELCPARCNGRCMPQGVLVSLKEPVSFSRYGDPGELTRKVNVTADHDWLARSGMFDAETAKPLHDFASRHLAVHRWHPSARAIALAEELMTPCPVVPALEPLYLESRAIELLSEAAFSLFEKPSTADTSGAEALPAAIRDRAREIESYLTRNLHRKLVIQTIANEVAISPSNLQRTCHAAYGCSLFDLLRNMRLERAQNYLLTGQKTVSEAAYAVGYNNPANFATAYKRAYGTSPSQAKRH